MSHNFNHKIINQIEYNNKCPNHFNQINTSFCTDCKINICDQCKKSKMHTKHNKYDFIEIEPTEDEIAQINDFCLKFKNNLNKIEISGKKEIQEIIEFKNKRILSIYKFFQAKNKKEKEENILKINKNLQIFEKKKEELKKKYDEDLKKLIDTYNNIKKKFEKELEDNINVYEQKYNEEKNKIELDYDSIILKLHKYNYELKMKYTNIIKL